MQVLQYCRRRKITLISDSKAVIGTAFPAIYEQFVDNGNLFPKHHYLFVSGLVYGFLHKLKSDKKIIKQYTYVDAISRRDFTLDILDIIYFLMKDGESSELEIFKEMLQIADGGILALEKIYKANKNFMINNLIIESEKLWIDQLKEFHNINLKE